jgi:hypothetical protein
MLLLRKIARLSYSGSQFGEVQPVVGAQGFAPSICTAAEQELLYQIKKLKKIIEMAIFGLSVSTS